MLGTSLLFRWHMSVVFRRPRSDGIQSLVLQVLASEARQARQHIYLCELTSGIDLAPLCSVSQENERRVGIVLCPA